MTIDCLVGSTEGIEALELPEGANLVAEEGVEEMLDKMVKSMSIPPELLIDSYAEVEK